MDLQSVSSLTSWSTRRLLHGGRVFVNEQSFRGPLSESPLVLFLLFLLFLLLLGSLFRSNDRLHDLLGGTLCTSNSVSLLAGKLPHDSSLLFLSKGAASNTRLNGGKVCYGLAILALICGKVGIRIGVFLGLVGDILPQLLP